MTQIVTSTIATRNWQRIRQISYITVVASMLLGIILVIAGFVFTGQAHSYVEEVFSSPVPTPEPQPETPAAPRQASLFTLTDLDNHPDNLHGAYTTLPLNSLDNLPVQENHLSNFRDLLGIYVSRQSEDDNFTVRVIDRRSSGLLERYTIENLKQEYQENGEADWQAIDAIRGTVSSKLIGKYRRRGVPLEDIMVKWGRLDQVKEARLRDEPFISYEIQLSQMLDLSLMATELGTVETFNDDRLISTVGARSRYQIMPYMLRRFGIQEYQLRTPAGNMVEVREEWHPLLTMEASFVIIKGYTNAVGHEIPGISAYHTGPFNIFKIYNMYLQSPKRMFTPSATVMDAYLWALTEGFDEVSESSGFRRYSRSYVATAYGSLKGAENIPVDTTKTDRIERVQTLVEEELYLKDLLEMLCRYDDQLNWGRANTDSSHYDRFRTLNQHIDLPDFEEGEEGIVPAKGNILLTTRRSTQPVRFFLPIGAVDLLKKDGFEKFDMLTTFRFDDNTYKLPAEGLTVWDEQYNALVDDIKHFGFTDENRTRLFILTDRFEKLYEADPTHYRSLQLQIIRLHKNLWRTRYWSELAHNTAAASGSAEVPALPSTPMGLTQRISFVEPAEEEVME